MHNSNNFIRKDDPLLGSVQKVMKENQIRRQVETFLNEELGIYSKKALPFEYHAAYNEVLEESVQASLAEEGKIQILDKKGFMNALKKGKKSSEKKESEKEHGVEKEREMASKKKGMYEELKGNQHKIDANKNGKVDAHDFKLLKKGVRPMEEENIEEKAPPGAKYERMVKHIKDKYKKDGLTKKEKAIAYATAWKASKKAELNEAGGAPGAMVQAMQNQAAAKAADAANTARMTSREGGSAPAPGIMDRVSQAATDAGNAIKSTAASALTSVVGADNSAKVQAFVKGTKPEDEKAQETQAGRGNTKDIVTTGVNAAKRAAADTATAVLGPERSAQLQAAVKGTDVAAERGQETEKQMAATRGQSQGGPTAAERNAATRTTPAARNEPQAPKPGEAAGRATGAAAPQKFEFTADEKAGKVSKERLDAWRSSQGESGKDLKLGNFLNAAQGKTAVAGGANDQNAAQKALNVKTAMGGRTGATVGGGVR